MADPRAPWIRPLARGGHMGHNPSLGARGHHRPARGTTGLAGAPPASQGTLSLAGAPRACLAHLRLVRAQVHIQSFQRHNSLSRAPEVLHSHHSPDPGAPRPARGTAGLAGTSPALQGYLEPVRDITCLLRTLQAC